MISFLGLQKVNGWQNDQSPSHAWTLVMALEKTVEPFCVRINQLKLIAPVFQLAMPRWSFRKLADEHRQTTR